MVIKVYLHFVHSPLGVRVVKVDHYQLCIAKYYGPLSFSLFRVLIFCLIIEF